MRRKRAEDWSGNIKSELDKITQKVISYHVPQHPISEDEQVTMWHWEITDAITEAEELLSSAGYGRPLLARSAYAKFVVPEWKLGVRWVTQDAYQQRDMKFMKLPTAGPYAIRTFKYGATSLRHIHEHELEEVLGEEQTRKLHEWAKLAAQFTVEVNEARVTIRDIIAMIKTPGQLARMVPDLVKYLSPAKQQLVLEQKRKSPFPEGWAEYDKSRIERLLALLARGHLVSTLVTKDIETSTESHTWAQEVPK